MIKVLTIIKDLIEARAYLFVTCLALSVVALLSPNLCLTCLKAINEDKS